MRPVSGIDGESRQRGSSVASFDALVDEASMDSFPASDPPSYWGRDAAEIRIKEKAADEETVGEEPTT